ncbi:ImmA/IrrE family metallo-endopeptidase [Chloroflexota bacterium]
MYLNLEQASNLITEKAKQLVKQLFEQRGHGEPPFSPSEFAGLQGIKKVVKADLGKVSAVLMKFHDGYEIKINQNHTLARQNFSCVHEIGHILFDELKLVHYTQQIEHRTTFDPQGQAKARMAARERLCDIAATELLMPELIFKKYMSSFGLSVNSILHLAALFEVSVRAAAWRVAEVSTNPCIAMLWNLDTRTGRNVLRLEWRSGPGRKDRGKTNYIPVHTRIAYPSILHKAYERDTTFRCYRRFKIDSDSNVKPLPVESKGFGRGENRRVISLAFLDSEVINKY